MVDNVAHSQFNASNTPKEKNHTPSGQGDEVAKAIHPVYPSVRQIRDVGRTCMVYIFLVDDVSELLA